MLEKFTTDTFTYEKLSKDEMERRGILGRLVGIIADSKNPTRNQRLYSSELWDRVFEDPIMKERIDNNCCFGELGHSEDRSEMDMEKVAICMDGYPKKNSRGQLMGIFNILNTPNGRILKSLCDYGCNIGISSRGTGDIITDYNGNDTVDPSTYECFGWDVVIVPALKEARLQYVTESLDKTRYNKTLKQKLTESINKEDENNQRIMRESLHDIGIDLDESLFEDIAEFPIEYTYTKDINGDHTETFYGHLNVKANSEEEAIVKADKYLHSTDFENKNVDIMSISNIRIGDTKYSNSDLVESVEYEPKFIDGMTIDELKAEEKEYYDAQYQYGKSLPMNRIWDINYTIKELEKNSLNESLEVPELTNSINGVMGAYQNANKWLDSVKEFIYTDLSCPFFSSFVHELAHTMPSRFDKFGDILHTMDIEIPYPTTLELDNELTSIDDAFAVIFGCLDDIKANLNSFIKLTDEEFHGMACSAEELLNDIEQEYPMLFRMRDKWNQCNGDLVDFDKFVAQYVEHKEDLLESLDESANITYKNTEIIENEDGTFNVTINDDTQIFNSLKNAKTYIDMMQPHLKEELYVSAGKMNDKLLNDVVREFENNIGDYGDALTFVKNRFSQYSLNDQKDIARYINRQLSESLNKDRIKKAKEVAEYNFTNQIDDIGFEFEGQFIINPWMDPTGRFEISDEKAVEIYGEENVNKFIELANSNKLTEAQVDAKTSIKRLGYELKSSGDEIPGAVYANGTQARVGDTVFDSNKDDFFTIVAARQDGGKVLIVKNSNMNHGDTTILSPGSPRWNAFSLKDRNAFRGSLTEAQVGRDDSKSIEDVGAEDNTPDPIPEPEKKPEEKEEKKETTIIIKEALNSTEENAADAALSELRAMENVDKEIIRNVVADSVNRYNTENVGPDYEEDPFAFEEADYFRVLDYVENKFNNDVNNNKDINEAVENNEADIDRIYEAFNKNIELEKKLTTLQEQLSASYARETKLREELGKYKNQVRKLAESSKEVEALEKKLERANFQISEIENGISANEHKLNESLENSNKVKSKLTESIRQRDSRIKSLEEELESTKKQNVTQINENKTLRKEYDSLQESYADAQKDVAQLKEQYSKKLDQKNELIEKYQKIANRAVDKYIESQAIKLGVTSNEIKNKLPRGYGFKDIDSICESLQGYKLNMSTLPFSTSSLNEGVSLKARNVRRELLPRNEENEITDLELELASKMLK